MKTLGLALLPLFLLPPVAACENDNLPVSKRLDEIDQKLAALGTKIEALAAKNGQATRQRPKRRGPAPHKTYSIPVDGAPVTGAPNAKVTVVKAFEFACPACERARGFEQQILAKFGDDIRIVHKNYIVHPGRAETPAYAACAANAQGKYHEMEALIWEKGFKARKLDQATMESLAAELDLDVARFKKDMAGSCVATVKRDHAELQAIGTSGTPTFFVNGRVLQERSLAGFEKLLAEERKKAEKRIASGTKPGAYYDEWVVKKGSKAM